MPPSTAVPHHDSAIVSNEIQMHGSAAGRPRAQVGARLVLLDEDQWPRGKYQARKPKSAVRPDVTAMAIIDQSMYRAASICAFACRLASSAAAVRCTNASGRETRLSAIWPSES